MSYKKIRIEDFQYDLPQDHIAIFPLENRDESKLLVLINNQIIERRFFELPELLPSDSLIIWNNTKVIPARLEFKKPTGAVIEIFLLEPISPSGYLNMFNQIGSCTWKVMIGNLKKWNGDSLIRTFESASEQVSLSAEYADIKDKSRILLKWTPEHLSFTQILELFGKTPIPPYLKRDSNDNDKTRYQTVYANFDGSVAAPTAGLHFTTELIDKLKEKNIRFDSLTLHVGSGTFIPIKTEAIGDHHMHAETVIIDKSTISNLLMTPPDKLTAVGTTSLRSLESLYWLGKKIALKPDSEIDHLIVDQWYPYNEAHSIDVPESLNAILKYLDKKGLDQIQFITRLMIVPGYRFRLVYRLITNFHLPSSTLLLLVSALIGDKWRDIYNYALANNFRFLSYGDSSLLEIQSNNHG
ncbi:MAG: S-adenosylmethionine:tRNA ribosyltransferase-isomerase [Bacteroidia bacterium]|nr:S-adenosylmethionine:tRNA ribosyltransferase-isomerase [Bacteroidia bacterium]